MTAENTPSALRANIEAVAVACAHMFVMLAIASGVLAVAVAITRSHPSPIEAVTGGDDVAAARPHQ